MVPVTSVIEEKYLKEDRALYIHTKITVVESESSGISISISISVRFCDDCLRELKRGQSEKVQVRSC